MIKWVLYVVLLLSVLCFLIIGSSEKNTTSLINTMSIESKNPGYEIPQAGNLHASNSTYKPGFIFVLGVVKKTMLKTISPDGAKKQPDNVNQVGGILTYEADTHNTGKIKLAYPIVSPQIAMLTKDDNISYGSLSPGKSWTPIVTFNASLDNISNGVDSNLVNTAKVNGMANDQLSLRSSSMSTYNYTFLQPVSPPFEFYSSNTSYSGNSSYYVGADGHTITLVNNESAVDPNYKQLIDFIQEDKTNEIPYNNTSFVCSDAAEKVHNNAEAFGFRSAWVYIDFENESATLNPETNALVVGHSCNLFNTTDKGLVAIDCTGSSCPSDMAASVDLSEWDNEVSLIKNGEYIPRILYSFPGSDKLQAFSSMGKITGFYVFW